jgi:hypothetical protein
MPTPFVHLVLARRLLHDPEMPQAVYVRLKASRGAFVLGNIAPDARVVAGFHRRDTHFHRARDPFGSLAHVEMFRRFPELASPDNGDQAAFIAGYAAHLAADQTWSQWIYLPYFLSRCDVVWEGWLDAIINHTLLVLWRDSIDYALLNPSDAAILGDARPGGWLPFISAGALAEWRDMVAAQLLPGGGSRSVSIMSERFGVPASRFADPIAHPALMAAQIWRHVPARAVYEAEKAMYLAAREAILFAISARETREKRSVELCMSS